MPALARCKGCGYELLWSAFPPPWACTHCEGMPEMEVLPAGTEWRRG